MRVLVCASAAILVVVSAAPVSGEMHISPPPGEAQFVEGVLLPDEHGIVAEEVPERVPCFSDEEWNSMEEEAAANRERLVAEGFLAMPDPSAAASVPALLHPLRLAPGSGWDYYEKTTAVVSNYVDHNPLFPGRLLDE